MTMFDPSMTGLSVGWILLAAGVISALVIATDKTSHTSDVSAQAGKLGSHHRDLKPVTRWTLVAVSILLASYGAFLAQEDHDWSPFQAPHFYTSEINTKPGA
jgi:hypothetical protein